MTNIQIFDHSWAQLTPDERAGVSLWVPTFTDHITLNHKQNNFTFEFSALDFIYPNGNRYAYKLDGFQHDWVYTDASKRLAFYNNLKPGNYTFHLRASNANGVWNNEPRLIQVTIYPLLGSRGGLILYTLALLQPSVTSFSALSAIVSFSPRLYIDAKWKTNSRGAESCQIAILYKHHS